VAIKKLHAEEFQQEIRRKNDEDVFSFAVFMHKDIAIDDHPSR
jgi:hypothetical protein